MKHTLLLSLLYFFLIAVSSNKLFAQADTLDYVYDTFFLAKKKGLLGQIGKSISTDPPKPEVTKTGTIKNDLPFNKYKGYSIRHIYTKRIQFNQNINDTFISKMNLGTRIANAFHTQTKTYIVKYNLFFEEGDKVFPYLIADNERHLRSQVFFEDAKIVMQPVGLNEVDITVITKDVFTIGGNVNAGGTTNFDVEIKDENFMGRAEKLSFKTLYDENRGPRTGFGGEFLKRNIKGSFADWSVGFKTFNGAFNSGRPEETIIYSKIDRPLVSPYLPFTGSAELSWRNTSNAYLTDSIFKSDFNYQYIDFDAWGGYNLGTKRYLKTNIQSRIRKFVAIRALHKQFQQVPGLYQNTYNFQYANVTGVLAAFNIFKQNFYKTKFIYGFGRQEDVPEGFSFSGIAGWTNRQGISSPYYGVDFNRNYFSKKGNYYNYTFRLGGYLYEDSFYDVDLLLNLEYFSRLKHITRRWYVRHFTTIGITHQIRPNLNQPLFLSSPFGLPEVANGGVAAQSRLTLKKEMTLYNTWRLLGFRFAPFIFGNGALLVPRSETFIKSDLFSSLGGGLRTRNESLIFGTIEVRASYFPRINPGMNHFRIDFTTDLRFRYNSVFIKRPDFVSAN